MPLRKITREVHVALVAAAIALLVSLSASYTTFEVSRRQNRDTKQLAVRNCQTSEHLKAVIRTQLRRGLESLPTITYYREHPDELRTQLAQIRRQLREFGALKCD